MVSQVAPGKDARISLFAVRGETRSIGCRRPKILCPEWFSVKVGISDRNILLNDTGALALAESVYDTLRTR